HEEPWDAGVSRELGMEGRRQDVALPDEHGRAIVLRQDLHTRPQVDEARGPDEDRGERTSGKARLERRFERVDLPPVGVSLDRRVEEAEARLGGRADLAREEDRAGAGTEERAALLREALERGEPRLVAEEAEERRALAARDHEARQLFQ